MFTPTTLKTPNLFPFFTQSPTRKFTLYAYVLMFSTSLVKQILIPYGFQHLCHKNFKCFDTIVMILHSRLGVRAGYCVCEPNFEKMVVVVLVFTLHDILEIFNVSCELETPKIFLLFSHHYKTFECLVKILFVGHIRIWTVYGEKHAHGQYFYSSQAACGPQAPVCRFPTQINLKIIRTEIKLKL